MLWVRGNMDAKNSISSRENMRAITEITDLHKLYQVFDLKLRKAPLWGKKGKKVKVGFIVCIHVNDMLCWLHNFLPWYIGTHTDTISSPWGECSAHFYMYAAIASHTYFYDFHRSTRYLFILLGTQRHTWSEKLAQGFYTWLGRESNPGLWIKSPGL